MDESAVKMALSSIRAAIDGLNDVALWSRSHADAMDETRECFALLQKAEALYALMVCDLEGRALPEGLPTKAFLRSAVRRTAAQAAGDVRAATNRLPKVGEAFTAGEISRLHVDVVVKTVDQIPPELRYRDVPKLPEFDTGDGSTVTVIEAVDAFFSLRARQYDTYQLQCLAKALLAALMPNEDDGFDPDAFARRQMSHARDETGMWHGSFTLDAAAGADFAAAVDHFSAPIAKRFETADDGSTVEIVDTRAPAQRRADALGLIARLAMSAAEAGTRGGEPPRVVLYTGVDDFHDAHCNDPTHVHPAPETAATDTAATDTAPDVIAAADSAPDATTADVGAADVIAQEAAASDTAIEAEAAAAGARTEAETVTSTETGTSAETAAAATGPPAGAGTGTRRLRGRVHGATDTHLGAIGLNLLARFSCDAVLQVALMHPTGAVLDLGRDVRTVTPAQRRALTARDRGCVIPGCTAPAAWCHGHHITWWEKGGRTDLDNVALVCGHHHTSVHLGGLWELKIIDGLPWARAPRYVDPQRRWLRNTYHEDLDAVRGLGAQMRLNLPGHGNTRQEEREHDASRDVRGDYAGQGHGRPPEPRSRASGRDTEPEDPRDPQSGGDTDGT